jgi:hypothetical protein
MAISNVAFCYKDETIKHLFFNCYYARFLWGLTHITFGISPPHNIIHMFGSWTNVIGGQLKRQLVDVSVFCWTIWLSRNDVVFDKSPIKSLL